MAETVEAGAGVIASTQAPVRVAYVVSRFPLVTETFIARELTRVASDRRLEVSLFSLFPAEGDVVPDDARAWVPKLERSGPRSALGGLLYWGVRSPRALARLIAEVVADYGRRPAVLGRALVALAAAAGHARTVERRGIEHVHAHFATYPALAAWAIGRLTGAGFSFTGHAHDLYVHQLGLSRRSREARFVVAISQFNRGFVAALAGSGVRQHVVRYGLDLTRYRPRAPLDHGHPQRIVMVSSFRDYKGHRVLVDAIASEPGLADVEFILIGDGPLREEITAYAQELGIERQLVFRGWLREGEVRTVLETVAALVQPSIVAGSGDSEGLPNTLIEAMALGVPVIGTDVTGVSELIVNGENGLLVEPGSAAALASALRTLVEDPVGARERADRGRRRIERQHDLGAQAALLADLFAGG